MNKREYWKGLSPERRSELAAQLGTSINYLRIVFMHGKKPARNVPGKLLNSVVVWLVRMSFVLMLLTRMTRFIFNLAPACPLNNGYSQRKNHAQHQ